MAKEAFEDEGETDARSILEKKVLDLQAEYAIAYSIPQLRTESNRVALKAKFELLMELLLEFDKLGL